MPNSAPSLTKTWEFLVNRVVTADQTIAGNAQNDRRKLLYEIKQALIDGSFTVPAIVKSSSNGTTASAADNWANETSLTWSTSGAAARAWIVLDLGVGELLLDLVQSATSDRGTRINAYFSTTAYSLVGTTTARPTTAGIEVQLCSSATSLDGSWEGTSTAISDHSYVYHVMRSSDGEETTIIVTLGAVMVSLWKFGKFGGLLPATPTHNWYACVSPQANSSVEFATSDKLSDDQLGRFFMLTNAGATAKCWLNIPITQLTNDRFEIDNTLFANKNPYDGRVPILQAQVLSTVVGWKMVVGNIKDLFIAPPFISNANAIPGTGDFISFGTLLFPWNGTIPIPS